MGEVQLFLFALSPLMHVLVQRMSSVHKFHPVIWTWSFSLKKNLHAGQLQNEEWTFEIWDCMCFIPFWNTFKATNSVSFLYYCVELHLIILAMALPECMADPYVRTHGYHNETICKVWSNGYFLSQTKWTVNSVLNAVPPKMLSTITFFQWCFSSICNVA